jgi:type II secretory pathway pseudopilin PulG
MKIKSNNKGISLIELLVGVAVVAITAPMLLWFFMFGIQSFSTYNKYIEQHDRVIDVTQRIRKDVEEAAAYKVVYDTTVSPIVASVLTVCIPYNDGNEDTFTIKTWRLEDGELLFKSCTGDYAKGHDEALDSTGYSKILDGLDTSTIEAPSSRYMPTRFQKYDNRVMLSIKPIERNKNVHKNRNVTKPVITEFSVDYKDQIN